MLAVFRFFFILAIDIRSFLHFCPYTWLMWSMYFRSLLFRNVLLVHRYKVFCWTCLYGRLCTMSVYAILAININFTLNGLILNTVTSCKYVGHIISATDDDNLDIVRQMGLLYARTNMLIRKFSKCDINVKLCLFRAYFTQFYGCSTWKRFKVTVMHRFEWLVKQKNPIGLPSQY